MAHTRADIQVKNKTAIISPIVYTFLADFQESPDVALATLAAIPELSKFMNGLCAYLENLNEDNFQTLTEEQWNDELPVLILRLNELNNFTGTHFEHALHAALTRACHSAPLQQQNETRERIRSTLLACISSLVAQPVMASDKKKVSESNHSTRKPVNASTSADELIRLLQPLLQASQKRYEARASMQPSDKEWFAMTEALIQGNAPALEKTFELIQLRLPEFTLPQLSTLAFYLNKSQLLHGALLNAFCARFLQFLPQNETEAPTQLLLLSEIAPIACLLANQVLVDRGIENAKKAVKGIFIAVKWALKKEALDVSLGLTPATATTATNQASLTQTKEGMVFENLKDTLWALGTLGMQLNRQEKLAFLSVIVPFVQQLGITLNPNSLFGLKSTDFIQGIKHLQMQLNTLGPVKIPPLHTLFEKTFSELRQESEPLLGNAIKASTFENAAVEGIVKAFSLTPNKPNSHEFVDPRQQQNCLKREASFNDCFNVKALFTYEGTQYGIDFENEPVHQLCWIPVEGPKCRTHFNGEVLGKKQFVADSNASSLVYINISRGYWEKMIAETAHERDKTALSNRIRKELIADRWSNDSCHCQQTPISAANATIRAYTPMLTHASAYATAVQNSIGWAAYHLKLEKEAAEALLQTDIHSRGIPPVVSYPFMKPPTLSAPPVLTDNSVPIIPVPANQPFPVPADAQQADLQTKAKSVIGSTTVSTLPAHVLFMAHMGGSTPNTLVTEALKQAKTVASLPLTATTATIASSSVKK